MKDEKVIIADQRNSFHAHGRGQSKSIALNPSSFILHPSSFIRHPSLALDRIIASGYCGVVSVHEPHHSIDLQGGAFAPGFSGNDLGVSLFRMRNSP
jgi:hypothetical protein